MKKYIALLLSVLLVLAMMAGCTPSNNDEPTDITEATDTQPTESTTINTEESYVYGTARLTWAQFWAGEEITYDASLEFDAINSTADSEGVNDLGGFDAVTRATSKHGVYRGSAHYSNLLHAVDDSGNRVSVYLEDMVDAASVEDMYGAGKNFYGVEDGGETAYCLIQPESGEYTTYTISDFEIVGYKAWPVKVAASDVEAAVELMNFREDSAITEETSMLKVVSIGDGDEITVGAAAASNGLAVKYTGAVTVSYNDKYGDYVFIQLSDCDPDWGMNLLGATYAYYGDTDPEADTAAQPIAVYGTKYAADTWWKSNGKLLQFGINTSYRQGGDGEAGGIEQHGYWQVTVMAYGYENYSFTVQSLPAYEAQVSASLAEDNKTLAITGIAESDWANTTVSVDGAVVEGFADGVAVLEGLAIGAHTVSINIESWREITAEVIAMSDLTAEDITLTGNVLTIDGGDLENYLKNITGIAVGENTLNGNDLGSVVFNADGSINFAAEISGRGGSTVVFPDGSGVSYTLIISAAGYPSVVLTTEAVG